MNGRWLGLKLTEDHGCHGRYVLGFGKGLRNYNRNLDGEALPDSKKNLVSDVVGLGCGHAQGINQTRADGEETTSHGQQRRKIAHPGQHSAAYKRCGR